MISQSSEARRCRLCGNLVSSPGHPWCPEAHDSKYVLTTPSEPLFVVTAYRWGLRDAHSYVVGAYSSLTMATVAAQDHLDYRGGKYGIEIVKCEGFPINGGNCAEQVAYLESPYFGLCGQNRPACQPMDRNKFLDPRESKDEKPDTGVNRTGPPESKGSNDKRF